MAIALGAHTLISTGGFTQATTLTTSPITTSATGSAFCISSANNGGTISSVLDSFSNLYTLKESASQFGMLAAIYLADGGTGGSGHTATINTSLANYSVALTEFTGAANPSFDVGNSGSNFSAGTTQTGAAVTSLNANDAIFSVLAFPGGGTAVTDSGAGFSIVDTTSSTADNGHTTSAAIVSSTGTYQDTYATTSGFSFCAFAAVALKAGAGGGPTIVDEDGDWFQFLQAA